jgi:hypothetical protein
MMNWKGYGRKNRGLLECTIPVFAWRVLEEHRNPSSRCLGLDSNRSRPEHRSEITCSLFHRYLLRICHRYQSMCDNGVVHAHFYNISNKPFKVPTRPWCQYLWLHLPENQRSGKY